MKKLTIIILFLISLFSVSSSVFAAEYSTRQYKIDHVEYSPYNQCYMAITSKDNTGGDWSLGIFNSTKENKNVTNLLNQMLKGKHVIINYDDQNSPNYEDATLINWGIAE